MKQLIFGGVVVLVAGAAAYVFMLVRYFPELLVNPEEFFSSLRKQPARPEVEVGR